MTEETQVAVVQPELTEKTHALVATAQGFVIDGPTANESAADFLKDCKRMEREVKDKVGPIVTKAHEAHKAAKKLENSLMEPIKEGRRIVGLKMGTYQREVEADRKMLEEQERARIAKEQEDEQVEFAQNLHEQGRYEEAEAVIAAPPMPVEVDLPDDTAKVKGTISRTTWHSEVIDARLVPRGYLIPDEKAIGAIVRARKGKIEIPGVKTWSTTNVTAKE